MRRLVRWPSIEGCKSRAAFAGKRGWQSGASKATLMHFDIAEAIRQKQQKQLKRIIIGNGKVVVLPGEPEDDVAPSEILPED